MAKWFLATGVIALIVLLSVNVEGASYSGGDESAENPYEIDNVTQLISLRQHSEGCDIDTSEPPASDANEVVLTALTLTRTNSLGTMDISERWNTLYSDDAWDTAIFEGCIPADPNAFDPTMFMNHPTNMMIHTPLREGENRTFTWYNARGLTDAGYFGVNLFFDDQQNYDIPGISVYAQMDTTGTGDGYPVFHANSAGSTMGWPMSSAAGTGSLIYKGQKLKVTMTEFVTYHQDVYSHDLVTQQTAGHPLNGHDGAIDMIGQFTLLVEEYQPQLACDDLIAMGGEYFEWDYNQDCYINLEDFAILAQDYYINLEGVVNLAQNWLRCNDPANPACE